MRARHGEGGAQHAEVARKRIAVALAAHREREQRRSQRPQHQHAGGQRVRERGVRHLLRGAQHGRVDQPTVVVLVVAHLKAQTRVAVRHDADLRPVSAGRSNDPVYVQREITVHLGNQQHEGAFSLRADIAKRQLVHGGAESRRAAGSIGEVGVLADEGFGPRRPVHGEHPTVHERDETVEIVIGHLDNAVGAVGRPEQVFVIIVVRDREHASRQQECDRGVNREAMRRAMRHEPPFRTTRSLHGAW